MLNISMCIVYTHTYIHVHMDVGIWTVGASCSCAVSSTTATHLTVWWWNPPHLQMLSFCLHNIILRALAFCEHLCHSCLNTQIQIQQQRASASFHILGASVLELLPCAGIAAMRMLVIIDQPKGNILCLWATMAALIIWWLWKRLYHPTRTSCSWSCDINERSPPTWFSFWWWSQNEEVATPLKKSLSSHSSEVRSVHSCSCKYFELKTRIQNLHFLDAATRVPLNWKFQ